MTKAQPGTTAAVLGASTNEKRYSFKAVRMLKEHGFAPIPVHPAGHTVDNIPGLKTLGDITNQIDTLTMYVSSKISDNLYDTIIKLNPRRVIFNPGAENLGLSNKLKDAGIEVINACTLVMLQTDQY